MTEYSCPIVGRSGLARTTVAGSGGSAGRNDRRPVFAHLRRAYRGQPRHHFWSGPRRTRAGPLRSKHSDCLIRCRCSCRRSRRSPPRLLLPKPPSNVWESFLCHTDGIRSTVGASTGVSDFSVDKSQIFALFGPIPTSRITPRPSKA
jgi:hypothetical protein